jgi:hypothetical protein
VSRQRVLVHVLLGHHRPSVKALPHTRWSGRDE